GVSVTSGIGGIGSTLTAYDMLKDKGWQRISPYTVPMLMPNGAAGWISIELGARAGAHALVSACASGAEAVGYGIDMIRSRRRDATVYAIAAGAGYSSDAYHIAHPAPDGSGVVAAITRAMADAHVDPGRVVHVNAHATSTPEGDAAEAQALAKALGPAVEG